MTCPAFEALFVGIGSFSLLVAVVAGTVGHGVLRPMLEARGVAPWSVRDSLGSMPLVLIGAAMIGGSGACFFAWALTQCVGSGVKITIVSVIMVWGVTLVRLGLVALRKLV